MSHGCDKEGGAAMLDINAELLALMPSKAVKILASNYCNKVIWQYDYTHEENNPLPCPKQWFILKYQEWLNHHPIDDGEALYNLEAEIAKYRIVAENAVAERENSDKALSGGKKMAREIPHALHNAHTRGLQ
jgi:hypothetical protein